MMHFKIFSLLKRYFFCPLSEHTWNSWNSKQFKEVYDFWKDNFAFEYLENNSF